MRGPARGRRMDIRARARGSRTPVWFTQLAMAASALKAPVMLAPAYLESAEMVCQPSSMMRVRAGVPHAARDCSPSSMPAADTCGVCVCAGTGAGRGGEQAARECGRGGAGWRALW